ncbi:NAD-dependent succinate-semialdehyde dehydrogenase [Rubrivirga sp. IMCC45206]|uniref:NAD-dependent succinate-semialdehyde dehydrogenase n=1 Tax=Rubrivirga sp. IMCC45206 TaxID=3391614 RepID=UPI00398FDF4D
MPTTVNPATEAEIARYETLGDDALDAALDRAADAFETHRRVSFDDRAAAMRRLADLLEEQKGDLGRLMTTEMGKPLEQAVAEAEKCAWVCRYYAEHAQAYLADEPRETEATRSFVAYEPLGPVLAVMPWNYPFWQAFRFAAPTVMAGGVGLLKHATSVLGCGDRMAELFAEAGFGPGVFQHLIIDHDQTAAVIADARVRAVTLTGSEGAGRIIGKQAGEALKPCVLELGGTDAFIVLADADLDAAVETGVTARTQNNGQSCIAAKRFILEAPIAQAFTERFTRRMAALTVGDPVAASTDIGPLARKDLREDIQDQVDRAVADGAEVLTGGAIPDGTGYYYPPTVLAGVTEGTVAFDEEIFGPVASLIVADDADDAARLANATRFGLGGSVWTADTERGERLARAVRSGAVFVNEMTKSHPNLPFGGIGASGHGRELARHGIRAFVNAKTIWVD